MPPARRILVTGMSGTGKSTALAELAQRGFDVVETDVPPWSEWSDADGGYVWREELVDELLAGQRRTTLFVSGTVSNQGRFYPRFDAVVLLSAPPDVLLERIEVRTTNEFGKTDEERDRIVADMAAVEPLLRATCTHEVDATKPVAEVVAELVEIASVDGQPVVCRADVAPVRAEPDDDAEQVTQALAGEPLTVEERRDGWARIRTAYEYPGWIREEALGEELAVDPWPAGLDHDVVGAARAYLGAPYEWGGMTERGIDCSGLVHMAHRQVGRLVPRDAHEQEAAAAEIDGADARPGDLVCFGEPGRAHHIGFWLGGGRILHATAREGVNAVVEEHIDNVDARPVRFARLTNP